MAAVEIVDHDPARPRMAATAIAELTAALPGTFAAIEHIGSTAVPGLAAKPVIDLMAAVEDLEVAEQREDALAGLGFGRHTNGMTGRLLYFRARDPIRGACGANIRHSRGACGTNTRHSRTHILHVVTLDSWPTRNRRILRDHLRGHPADAARYAELKLAIAAAGARLEGYTAAKTELIQELTDRARRERGLPPVPVWEK